MQLLNVPLDGAFYLKSETAEPDPHAVMLETVDIVVALMKAQHLSCIFPALSVKSGFIWNWYNLDSLPGCSRWVQVRCDT